ncbi:PLP-dependent aminotransferase family protein [Albimonas pacifica]|uniref:Transcriptional regulator, GntR family n=1 Tax=Albimonas pacifica TaxID=1114924 RepID=A0A1I3EN24_9RHOB|nr:PLP-dependent aminotransferase family protein [Albimonas pacifica]SFI00273.1 transcriptional regulator, GntR family [Albimonas pacifica]
MEPDGLASLVPLDPAAARPLTAQIYDALRGAAREGRLPAGARLPSTRGAAAALGVGRNTVAAAYDLLRAEGVIEIRPGAAPVVLCGAVAPRPRRGRARPAAVPAPGPPAPATLGPAAAADVHSPVRRASPGWFHPGLPDEALLPRDLWARTLRAQARGTHGRRLTGGEDSHGLDRLRAALAERLRADRGVVVPPERLLVVNGTQAALLLTAMTAARPGEGALVESPGYGGARLAFAAAGLRVSDLPVDRHGADVSRAADPAARIAFVTPSNQYPTTARMPLPRRQALVDWARRADALVVEDDCDGEFHWRGRRIGALQATGPEVVAHMGSAEKTLAIGLRLAWLAVPERWVEPMRRAHRNLGLGANLHAQATLAELMQSGAWRAHLRRIARSYREREALLADALTRRLGRRVGLRRPDGGLQSAVELPDRASELRCVAALAAAGFSVGALSEYGGDEPGPCGLLVGFAQATPALAERFAAVLDAALSAGAKGETTADPASLLPPRGRSFQCGSNSA